MAKRRHGGLGRGLDALIPAEGAGTESRGSAGSPAEGSGTEYTGNAGADTDAGSVKSAISNGREPDDGQGQVRMLRLSQVDPDRKQPRTQFEEEALEELADSIRQFGVLQPILVRKNGSRYVIIAGERRWRASRRAGLREIPAIVKEYSNQEAVELSLIENIQREDLNPIEEAKAFRRLLDEFGLRQEDLAARVSKSRTAITNSIRLLKLDKRVQDMVVEGRLSMGHARALISVEIPEEQYLLALQAAEKHLSVRDVEKLVKRIGAAGKARQKAGQSGANEKLDPVLELACRAMEERLKQSLGTKASIRAGRGGTGKIEIEYYSQEDLEKIIDLLT